MNRTHDFKLNMPDYSDAVDVEDFNDNFRVIDDALMAGLCRKEYTGNNMGSSDPASRKYAWAPFYEIKNENEFDVVVTDRNISPDLPGASITIEAGETYRKYINGTYYMNFYVQDQHDVTFKWFCDAETRINEIDPSGGGSVSSVNVTGASSSHIVTSGGPITSSGTIEIDLAEGYSIPQTSKQTAWDGKAADLKAEIDSSTYVLTLQLKDSSGNLIGNERTIDLPLETMVVDGEYDSQTQKIKLELKNGNYVEFSVADLVSGLQTELSSSNKLDPTYIAYDATHRAVSDTEKDTWSGKQNAISDLETIRSGASAGATAVQPAAMESALATKQNTIDSSHKLASSLISFVTAEAAALASGIDSTKVGQISTNQTNIRYNLNNGTKNLLKLTGDVVNPNVVRVYWDYAEGVVSVTGSSAATSPIYIYLGRFTAPKTGEYVLSASGADVSTSNIYVYDDASWNTTTSPVATWAEGTSRQIYLRIATGVVVGDITIKPMICEKSVYDFDPTVQSHALPNQVLTPALIDVVDSGAKNLLKYDMTQLAALNPLWTVSGNTIQPSSDTHITFTLNSDMSIRIQSDGSNAQAELCICTSNYSSLKADTYVLSGCPTGGNSSTTYDLRFIEQSSPKKYTADSGLGKEITWSAQYAYTCNIMVRANQNIDKTFKPMICTKAVWGVSQKHVPYRPDWDNVAEKPQVTANISTAIDGFSTTRVDMGYVGSSSTITDISSEYVTVRTYKTDATLDRRVQIIESAGGVRKTRYFNGVSWGNWT